MFNNLSHRTRLKLVTTSRFRLTTEPPDRWFSACLGKSPGFYSSYEVCGSYCHVHKTILSSFLGRCDDEPLLRIAEIFRVSNKWVTHVAWSSWICEKPSCCQYFSFHLMYLSNPRAYFWHVFRYSVFFQLGVAYLACAISDGSIEIVKINQCLEFSDIESEFVRKFSVKHSYEILSSKPSVEDGKKVTALAWIEPKNTQVIWTYRVLGTCINLDV